MKDSTTGVTSEVESRSVNQSLKEAEYSDLISESQMVPHVLVMFRMVIY